MTMPSWKTFLQVLVLLAIAGFVLTILSGFWHVLALLILAIALLSLWRGWPKAKK
jgi:hypothetical protein